MPIASSAGSDKTGMTVTDNWNGGVRLDQPHHSIGTNMTKGGHGESASSFLLKKN